MNIGLGTAALGRPQYINIRQENNANTLAEFKKQSRAVLEQAYQSGVRYFDTAPGYGMAESLLLDWVQSKQDQSITIATKWGYTYVANFDPEAKVHEIKEHSLKKLNAQWEVSKAFGSYLRVYQIHSATLDTGVLENAAILERLEALKKQYPLKIGLTSTGANQTEVLQKAMNVTVGGKPLFDAFQITYNILDQSTYALATQLLQEGKLVVLKETLANGRIFRNPQYLQYHKVYTTIETLATKYQVGLDAIALRFCMQTLPGSMVLSGASKIAHVEHNLAACNFVLTPSEIAQLKTLSIDVNSYWKERGQLQWN